MEAFGLKHGEVISLVGGGGKTSLMFALAHELASGGRPVITTTTTKILEPAPDETDLLIVEPDEERLTETVLKSLEKYSQVTVASERLPLGKLRGIRPELVDRLGRLNQVFCIIVEADGAAGRSLKAPIDKEPVIPKSTSLVIPVVGIDAVGCPLTEKDVFRVETVSKLLGLPLGAVILAEHIAFLITHPQGITKGSPPDAGIIPFINKMDLEGALEKGRELAHKILKMNHPRIDRVVLGQAKLPEAVVEVVKS